MWADCRKMMFGEIRENFPTNNSSERLLRVPGGWIYTYGDTQGTSSVFVPYTERD
jgi:hypothetical protein